MDTRPRLTHLRLEQFVVGGTLRRARHDLVPGAPVLVGRAREAQVWLEDESVSRRHCLLECLPSGTGAPSWWVKDLGSRMGVVVNETPVRQPTRVRPGDLLRVGASELLVEHGAALDGGPCAGCERTAAQGARAPGLAQGRHWVCDGCLLGQGREGVWRSGDWVEVKEVGQGSYGKVLLAAWRGRRLAAVKLGKPDPFSGPDEAAEQDARFRREAIVLRGLDHPAILRLYEAVGTAQLRWVALELGDEDLHQRVKRDGPVAPWQAVLAGASLLEGLAHVHALGVLHRDVKPTNVIVASDGSIRLGDFGLCIASGLTRVTETRLGMGTLHFAAPEQLDDAHDVDARADVYGWGATLYYLLTGRSPYFEARNYGELVRAYAEPPPRPDRIDPRIPAGLADVVMRALERDPARRHAGARAALDALVASSA